MNIPPINQSDRMGHHLAYLCFLSPILLSIVAGLSQMMTLDIGTAGGVGFLILIPLALLALVSVPAGIILSLRYRKDYVLLILAFITILYVVEILTEAGTVQFYNLTLSIYGISGSIFVASWFLYRRKRYYPVHEEPLT